MRMVCGALRAITFWLERSASTARACRSRSPNAAAIADISLSSPTAWEGTRLPVAGGKLQERVMSQGRASHPDAVGACSADLEKPARAGEVSSGDLQIGPRFSYRKLERLWWALIRTTFESWWNDNCLRLGASLAFYTVFSTAPLLIIAVLIVGLVYGDDAAQGRIAEQLQGVMGQDAARGVQAMIATAQRTHGLQATILSMLALFIGASGAFSDLQSGLNVIWKARTKRLDSWWMTVRNRALSYVMVLCIGVLILSLLVISSAAAAFWESAWRHAPLSGTVVHTVNFAAMLAVETSLFALIFKFLPDAHIAWKDVWLGAFVTAVLFAVGNLLTGIYLRSSAIASAYGAAGSPAIFLLWAYYSALMLYLGAEFTQVYARLFGSQIGPESYVEEVPPSD